MTSKSMSIVQIKDVGTVRAELAMNIAKTLAHQWSANSLSFVAQQSAKKRWNNPICYSGLRIELGGRELA
jgi:hypothetical protein